MNNILRNVMRQHVAAEASHPRRGTDGDLSAGKMLSNAARNQEWHFTQLQNRGLMKQLAPAARRWWRGCMGTFGGSALTGGSLVESAAFDRLDESDNKFRRRCGEYGLWRDDVSGGEVIRDRLCWLTFCAGSAARAPAAKREQLSIPAGYEPLRRVF